MTTAELIEDAAADGVILSLTSSGKVAVAGNKVAVDQWVALIKSSKAEIVAELHLAQRRTHVLTMLKDNPEIRYAIEVIDVNDDPVTVAVAIRDTATFELTIPQERYDAFALLEVIQTNTGGVPYIENSLLTGETEESAKGEVDAAQ